MKKLAISLSVFCFVQIAHARVTNDQNSPYSPPIKVQKPTFQVPLQTHHDGAPEGIGFFTFGEFLYWIANEDGLQPVVKQVPSTNPAFGFFQILKFDRFQFHFDPGFRIGLGYHFDQRNWDVESIWTQYYTRWANPFISDPGEQLDTLWGDPGGSVSTATIFNGAQRFKLRYNTVDLVLKPSFLRFDYFSIQPKVGVRGGVCCTTL